MYDKGKVIVGVIIFLAIFALPFWYSQVTGEADFDPHPDVTSLQERGITECVESADYMRSKHVNLLDEWRDEVVRGADRVYISKEYGTEYDKSLTDTCLEACHDNKSEFCDQCHDYVGVQPDCWECHNVVEEE